ncbi:hypothetical protein PL81_22305 [Streptomyces sp. RSD-27]|nr:hypothetical protein PL81_22305 [Streptomyces sp. RSD-27]
MLALTSTIVWAACVIHVPAASPYRPSSSVALPARLTQSWKAWAASPSQPVTRCRLRLSPISVIAFAAFASCAARALTVSGSREAIIASSCSCE